MNQTADAQPFGASLLHQQKVPATARHALQAFLPREFHPMTYWTMQDKCPALRPINHLVVALLRSQQFSFIIAYFPRSVLIDSDPDQLSQRQINLRFVFLVFEYHGHQLFTKLFLSNQTVVGMFYGSCYVKHQSSGKRHDSPFFSDVRQFIDVVGSKSQLFLAIFGKEPFKDRPLRSRACRASLGPKVHNCRLARLVIQ